MRMLTTSVEELRDKLDLACKIISPQSPLEAHQKVVWSYEKGLHYINAVSGTAQLKIRVDTELTPEDHEEAFQLSESLVSFIRSSAESPVLEIDFKGDPESSRAVCSSASIQGIRLDIRECQGSYQLPEDYEEELSTSFASVLGLISKVTKNDPLRPMLSCVYATQTKEGLALIASDSIRLHMTEIKDFFSESFTDLLISQPVLLSTFISLLKTPVIYFRVSDRSLIFRSDDGSFLILPYIGSADFPDWESLIEQNLVRAKITWVNLSKKKWASKIKILKPQFRSPTAVAALEQVDNVIYFVGYDKQGIGLKEFVRVPLNSGDPLCKGTFQVFFKFSYFQEALEALPVDTFFVKADPSSSLFVISDPLDSFASMLLPRSNQMSVTCLISPTRVSQ